ncbi:MAG TPA: YggS family pyridoxal phosphate-dependent enzyme [Phnomibacter sp.]|nr:YggS family pyridoxal phosphate-dependent enzyme [Phnomibacter sp.]
MSVNKENYSAINHYCQQRAVQLVAVSKTKPVEDILALYELGQRDFGENYVQELVEKQAQLPSDIRWHFIGHLQSNKVKYIAPFVHLIHGVDSFKLLKEINKQAAKNNRVVGCLLQMHIAKEETKFGLDEAELQEILGSTEFTSLTNVYVQGLMGMASFSDDKTLVQTEFNQLQKIFQQHSATQTANCHFQTLSMGMSGDYEMAVDAGSNMVRIGSLLFGAR